MKLLHRTSITNIINFEHNIIKINSKTAFLLSSHTFCCFADSSGSTLNSNLGLKANASDVTALSAKIIGDGVNFTSIQVKNGSTWYRLQLGGDGAVTVFKSSDSGATWTQNKVISTGF